MEAEISMVTKEKPKYKEYIKKACRQAQKKEKKYTKYGILLDSMPVKQLKMGGNLLYD